MTKCGKNCLICPYIFETKQVEGINFYTGFCVEGHTHAIRNEDKQKQAISTFINIDEKRKCIKQGAQGKEVPFNQDNLPPGGNTARTQAVQAIDTIV